MAQYVHGLFRHVIRDLLGERLSSATAALDSDYENWSLHVLHELSAIALDLRRDCTLQSGEPPYNMVYPISYMAILENDRFLTPCCPGLAIVFAASRDWRPKRVRYSAGWNRNPSFHIFDRFSWH